MAKGLETRVPERLCFISKAISKERAKSRKWFSGNDLCALCLLCADLKVFIRRGVRGRIISILERERMTMDRRDPRGHSAAEPQPK
jgi:hypothetical protein